MAIELADHLTAVLSELRYHPTPKRVRAWLDGTTVIDSTRAVIVWEPRRIVPVFAVPVADIAAALAPTTPTTAVEHVVQVGDGPPVLDPSTGFGRHTTAGETFDVTVGDRTLAGAAFAPGDPALAGLVIVDFDAFDEWQEEDDVLVAHARDPFSTVDTRHSSRRVVVEITGHVVADSTRTIMLFETWLPTRYYLTPDDVRMDLLTPTTTTTACAYKGWASYWSADVDGTVVRDVAWSYPDPHNYATAVGGMICFFNERVDITLDGERQERPRTPWS